MDRRTRSLLMLSRVAAALLVVVAAGALAGITLGRDNGGAASAAYYGYCPDGSAPSMYGYCPPPNRPPNCSTVVADKEELNPADHRFRLVTLSGGSDPDGDTLTLTITGVTQDEPVDAPGSGDGNTSPDAEAGPNSHSVYLRRERANSGNGRVYRISFTLSDGKGGTCSGMVKVGVPRTKGTDAIDSAPPSYNSFGP
jgi:hypothetical protein